MRTVASSGGSLDEMPTLVRDPSRRSSRRCSSGGAASGRICSTRSGGCAAHESGAAQPDTDASNGSSRDPGTAGGGAGLRALGQFNLGEEGDYRVPDGALVRPGPDAVYLPTAALVLEIVSPGDETWEKLGFYAARG